MVRSWGWVRRAPKTKFWGIFDLASHLIIVLNGIFDAYRSVINATLTQDPPSFFLMTRLAPWMWFFSVHSLFTHQLPNCIYRPSFWLAKFKHLKNNARHHLTCSTRAAPAWFEWSQLFKLYDWVEFFPKIIFRANGEKNNLKKFNEIKKFKMQAQLQNQAGAALVIHIKWLRALFFKMDKVGE